MYHKMLGILSNIIELTNRRPQGKTLKTHYRVFIKLVFGFYIAMAFILLSSHESHMLLY